MSKRFIIAIDLGGTNLRIALLDAQYKIRKKDTLSTRAFRNKEKLISAVVLSVKKIICDSKLNRKDILGLGLGLPGPIDARRGIVHFLPNIAGFREAALKNILAKRCKLPVFLDNDAKLMCLAEHRLGAARGFKNALCITLGTGVGGSFVLEGRLYRGADNAAGEIGHLPINEAGPRCNCGGMACLESYIGNNKIIKEARGLFKRDISLEELSSLARRGNRLALEVWKKVGSRLGVALAGAVNLLNLDTIVIGGGVAGAGRLLFAQVAKTVRARGMSVQAGRVKILKAALGSDAGLIGAAIMVKENR